MSDKQWLSDSLKKYIFRTFEAKSEEMNKSIQFEVSRSSLLCFPNTRKLRLPKIEKKVLVAALLNLGHYPLFIINTLKKTSSHLDPMNLNPAATETHFTALKDFIVKHNAAYSKFVLPTEDWTIKNFTYPLQNDGFNRGVCHLLR